MKKILFLGTMFLIFLNLPTKYIVQSAQIYNLSQKTGLTDELLENKRKVSKKSQSLVTRPIKGPSNKGV